MTPALTTKIQPSETTAHDFDTNDVVVDIYHGVKVADPFRWLEDHQSLRTRMWIDEEAARTRSYLNAIPCREANIRRVAELLDRQSIGDIREIGNIIYYTRRNPEEEQARLYRRDGLNGRDTLLLDPTGLGESSSLSLTIIDISPDGKLLAYGLRTGGQGARRVRILNLETGETLPDELPKGGLRGFSFLPKSNGFLYVTELSEKPDNPKTARLHFLGDPSEADKMIFYGGRGNNVRLLSGIDPGTSVVTHTIVRATDGQNFTSVYLQKIDECGAPTMTLAEDVSGTLDVRIHENQIYIFIDRENDTGRKLLRIPLSAPDIGQANVILLEGTLYIQSWHIFGDRILIHSVEDLSSAIRLYNTDGVLLNAIDLPGSGTVRIIGGDLNGFFFSFESYTQPVEVYYHDFASRQSVLFSDPQESSTRLSVQLTEFKSFDGTLIPLTLLGRQKTLEAGQSPVILTAYGAAGVCLTPRFSPLANRFVELGGIFAVAHIRGGGELGHSWHEAGKRRNRPVVNLDFLAASEFLINTGIARCGRLAIVGGSNSGLLVATAMTQRPDLFCAVMCVAPITDMLRYQRFDNTQFHIPQLGTASDPQDFPVLLSYSPYHNIHDGVRYPAMLMISGDGDTRCDPMHARKFVARLQAAAVGLTEKERRERPVLLDWNPLRGHFPTLPLATRACGIVDRLAFLCHHLGMENI